MVLVLCVDDGEHCKRMRVMLKMTTPVINVLLMVTTIMVNGIGELDDDRDVDSLGHDGHFTEIADVDGADFTMGVVFLKTKKWRCGLTAR